MRNNQPVTQNEVQLDAQSLIVSKTDLKWQITYINKDFIDISGFTEAELIGQPHNIVRHPDMAVEAYEDMWRDLMDGRPPRPPKPVSAPAPRPKDDAPGAAPNAAAPAA